MTRVRRNSMLYYYPHLTDRELHLREITALTRSTEEISADQKCQSEVMQTQRLQIGPKSASLSTYGDQISPGHTNEISNHGVLTSEPHGLKSVAHRNWRKCTVAKLPTMSIYTCWEFGLIHSLHPITQTINHWNCQILYIFNVRSKKASSL